MTDLKNVSTLQNNFANCQGSTNVLPCFLWERIYVEYFTVYRAAKDELTEKRSRFIGYCKPVAAEDEAVAFINEIRSKHWDARHNVYAYSLREGNLRRYSDDGEPSGTAGMPVLDVITKSGVTDVCVVVTRYFGGVLLGTGGLVRAYSQAARLALDAGEIVKMCRCVCCVLHCSYNQYGKVAALVQELSAGVDDTVYEADVALCFHITPQSLPLLEKQLADATAGEVKVLQENEKFFPVFAKNAKE